jgi:hypothetical protein
VPATGELPGPLHVLTWPKEDLVAFLTYAIGIKRGHREVIVTVLPVVNKTFSAIDVTVVLVHGINKPPKSWLGIPIAPYASSNGWSGGRSGILLAIVHD